MALNGVRTLCQEEKPIESSFVNVAQPFSDEVGLLLVQAHDVCERGSFAQMEPGGIMPVQVEACSVQKERGPNAVQGRRIDIVIAFANANDFLEQRRSSYASLLHSDGVHGEIAWILHPGLHHNECAQ